ncbi:MAG: hypothetical protein K2O31_02970 [Clostridia bacterium]|nr:hypothetical protein [Clostridia bacterium]MDE7208823.1 hypothetical protein [Clostridia bacterium]
MKEKLKSYEFWVSIVSAVMVVLQSISLKFDLPYIQEIVMGFLGVLAVAGIVKKKDPPTDDTYDGNSAEDTNLTDSSQEEDEL